MDYLAHGIWSYIFFHRHKNVRYAVLFGLLPDSTSWMLYSIYTIITQNGQFGKPNITAVPDWVFTLYNISHSLVVAVAVLLIVRLIYKKIPIYMWAWPIAISIDVPTHTREFLPTPFLWPISEWRFPGFSWASPTFMISNYLLILIALSYIAKTRKNKV